MKTITFFISFLFLVFSFIPLTFAQDTKTAVSSEQRLEAIVVNIRDEKVLTDGGVNRKYQKIELLVTSGELKNKKIIVENGKAPVINSVEYREKDKVSVSITKNPQGTNTYYITDHIRRDSLYLLFGIFVLVTLIIGGLRGIASLLGMVISFALIFFFVLPMILKGFDPILVVIISSALIIPITFYLSHGLNKKTTVAVFGTLIALVITGVLAQFFVDFAHLSGLSSDDATFLAAAKPGFVQLKGLLLAGIIIGALGVLDDITISQSSIVFQLKKTLPKLGIWELFRKGMDIGRDHIASMVNTLILVYTGAALPLLLLFVNNPRPFAEVINYELIAEEIVRTLVVSMGLILAVPIVTFIAAVAAEVELKKAAKDILHSLK